MITRGYFGNPQATADAFTADRWFRTGDLGHIRDGRLTLVGRSKDSIIVNGVNYFSHEIETSIEELDGIARGYVAAFPTRRTGTDTEQLVVAVGTEPDQDEADRHRLLTAVRSTVVLTCGFRPDLVIPVPKSAFPKTSLGKTLRQRMRQRLESGGFDDIIAQSAAATTRQLGGYTPPTGDTEVALAEIYADIFDIPVNEISATTSLFDLGGTSLDILRLRQHVSRRLDVMDLQIITLLTAPSIRQLSDRLDTTNDDRTPAYDPLVPLQTGGTKTPLFCVHPGVGEVLVFVNLAKYFTGDRPFYALRARGFNHGETPFTSFKEMVESYAAAIRARQRHGPYAIAGYSYGAAVAFEIAKELESAGERVDFIGSINLPPHIKYRMEELDFTETATNLAMFLDLITKPQATHLPTELRERPKPEQLSHLLQLAPVGRTAELDLDLAKFTAWAELAHGLTNLARTYTPTGTVRSMTVFCAIPLRGTKHDWIEKELHRWDEFTAQPNRYVDVPGEHYTLMGPRHVAAFQSILRKELDRALADADTR
jgi:thioesterase domain-containing protein